MFNIGAASCGVPGTPAGLAEANRSFGSMPLDELLKPAIGLARDGVVVNRQQAYLIKILAPILSHRAGGDGDLRAGRARPCARASASASRSSATRSSCSRPRAPSPSTRATVAARICEWVGERGGALAPEDLAAYEPVAREPVRIRFMGSEILTNPPPSAGGLLIAFALALLERLERADLPALVAAMEEAQEARTEEFAAGLYEPGFADRFLDPAVMDVAERRCREAIRPPPGAPGPR